MNLTEELDKAFGDGPEHRPIEDRLAAGRRAVRRRRAATAAAALAVVAVVGTTGLALAGRDDPSTGPGIATQPPSEPADSSEEGALAEGREVGIDRDGELHTAKGVEVVETAPNPMDYQAPDHSLGVAYKFDGDLHWALTTYQLHRNSGSGFTTSEVAQRSFPTFEYWLDDQVALQRGEPTLALVSFADGETLVPRDGVEILQQTGEVDLPGAFAGPKARTAVAEVTYAGERWYVLARQLGGSAPEYFPSAARVTRPTLEQFLDYADEAYANEEGLR